MFILRIFRCKMESDCFENGLKFLWNLSIYRFIWLCIKSKNIVVEINIRIAFIINKVFISWKRNKWQRLSAIISLYSRWHYFHSTTKRESNLTFSVFTSDNNRTIIQISNLIFLLTQTLYLIPEFSSVFKCPLGEILINKYVGAFQLSTIFQDILFVFKIYQTTDDCHWLIFFTVFCFFCSVGSFYDNFFFNV